MREAAGGRLAAWRVLDRRAPAPRATPARRPPRPQKAAPRVRKAFHAPCAIDPEAAAELAGPAQSQAAHRVRRAGWCGAEAAVVVARHPQDQAALGLDGAQCRDGCRMEAAVGPGQRHEACDEGAPGGMSAADLLEQHAGHRRGAHQEHGASACGEQGVASPRPEPLARFRGHHRSERPAQGGRVDRPRRAQEPEGDPSDDRAREKHRPRAGGRRPGPGPRERGGRECPEERQDDLERAFATRDQAPDPPGNPGPPRVDLLRSGGLPVVLQGVVTARRERDPGVLGIRLLGRHPPVDRSGERGARIERVAAQQHAA